MKNITRLCCAILAVLIVGCGDGDDNDSDPYLVQSL